jgi:hypothetical protein
MKIFDRYGATRGSLVPPPQTIPSSPQRFTGCNANDLTDEVI